MAFEFIQIQPRQRKTIYTIYVNGTLISNLGFQPAWGLTGLTYSTIQPNIYLMSTPTSLIILGSSRVNILKGINWSSPSTFFSSSNHITKSFKKPFEIPKQLIHLHLMIPPSNLHANTSVLVQNSNYNLPKVQLLKSQPTISICKNKPYWFRIQNILFFKLKMGKYFLCKETYSIRCNIVTRFTDL